MPAGCGDDEAKHQGEVMNQPLPRQFIPTAVLAIFAAFMGGVLCGSLLHFAIQDKRDFRDTTSFPKAWKLGDVKAVCPSAHWHYHNRPIEDGRALLLNMLTEKLKGQPTVESVGQPTDAYLFLYVDLYESADGPPYHCHAELLVYQQIDPQQKLIIDRFKSSGAYMSDSDNIAQAYLGAAGCVDRFVTKWAAARKRSE